MTQKIELYCKEGHLLEKVMISGVNNPLNRMAVNSMDSTEIIYRCPLCGHVFNKIEVGGDGVFWNKKRVMKGSRFDQIGNLIVQ